MRITSYLSHAKVGKIEMKIRDVLSPRDYADVQHILGPRMPPELRAEIEAALVRSPPTTLTPPEMQAMYGVDTPDEELERDKVRAEVAKLRADARRLDAEARSA
jgi:hypothetical protein